jgi:predicted ester cyclase
MGKKDLLILVNITGSYLNIEILDELKKAGRIIKEITRKEAIVGITGYKKILLQIVQTFTNLRFNVFNTLEDAKNWLVEEQKEM